MPVSDPKPEGRRDICKAFGDKQVEQWDPEDLCEGPDELVDCIKGN